jgi:hypothetical protein
MINPLRQIKQKWLLAGLFILTMGWLSSSLGAMQFYKPNREAHLFVSLKSKARYSARQPVIVTVMISNQSTEPVLINSRMLFNKYPANGEISFNIEGPGSKEFPLLKVVSLPPDVRGDELTVLNAGETMEREADLTDMYGIHKKGTYKVQVIYYNKVDLKKNKLKTWRGSIASEPVEFSLR